jgi:catechol 2,3-dioxygenase-like lactoylglutathione lyase family enzyme
MIDINGMAHVILTVSQYDKAKQFYARLMPALGLECVFDGSNMCYFVGGRTALGIQPCSPEFAEDRFVQGRVGLHHICFRARSRKDVDQVSALLKEMDAHVVSPAREGPWAPGYYYVLCEDPDGIRVEVNFVPGQGVLADGESFNPADDWKK